MADSTEYMMLTGIVRDVEAKLITQTRQGWKPILMNTYIVPGPVPQPQIVMVLELVRK
jgi:hypothetical protein